MTTLSPEALGAELKARLATCTVAQGAETNLGVKVFRGRRKIDDDMMPCAVVVEGDAQPVERKGRTNEYALRADCAWHAYVPCDPADPNLAAHAALRDMRRALWGDGSTLGRKVKDVEFLGTDIAPRVDGAAFVLAVLTFAVHLVEDVGDPV